MAKSSIGVLVDWITGMAAGALGVTALVVALTGSAQAKPASCSASITECGCVIDTTGTYEVANDLDSTQGLTANNSCIEIAADHVILNAKGFAIIGAGSGTGILIQNSAGFAVVQGTDAGAADQAIINSWNVGIEDNANNSVIELFRQIGGNLFNQHGNTKAGILLKTASNTTLDDFNASFNGESGVEIRNGSGNRLLNFDTISNGASGVLLRSSNENTLTNCTSNSNGAYGVDLDNSSQNQIFTSSLNTNGNDGLLLGCGKSDQKGCGSKGSDRNHLSNSGTNGNTGTGITVTKGSNGNAITNMTANGNQGSFDLVDENHKCGDDLWYNNVFGQVSDSNCIH